VTVTPGRPSEFAFQLSAKTIKHGPVTFKVTNGGSLPHDFKICASSKGGSANSCTGKATKLISPGSSTTLSYTFKTKGTYEFLCTVPGHAAAGMKGDLKVT
jgi:nitrite reductase (NO-forming)